VLRHLAGNWPGERFEPSYGFLENRRYVVGRLSSLGEVIGSTFGEHARLDVQTRAATVRKALRATATASIARHELQATFDAYVLPEPSFHKESIAVASRLMRSEGTTAFFMYYDALPLTHPEFFHLDAEREMPLIRYNTTVARSDNVAFISGWIREVFEARIARRTLRNAVVTRLGADGLIKAPPRPPPTPTFTVVGTLEPRKRYSTLLDAFERLWMEGHHFRLVVIGSPASDTEAVERLRRHSRAARLTWFEHADDDELATALSQSSGMIFISDAEGYGLPPLEALAVGCPVIVSADLPALDAVPDAGQLRLETVTAESLVSAIKTLADPISNEVYRAAIAELVLPTWEAYAGDVEHWVASVLDDERKDNGHG